MKIKRSITIERTSLWILEKFMQFDTRLDIYVDVDGNESVMKWIPPFRACRALTSTAAVATPSGTVGDFFHPDDIQSGWVEDTDYEIVGYAARLTSGTLTVGKWYKIVTYVSGDDFTNVGAPQNASGQCFCATGTTPTTWTNSSALEQNSMGGFWVDMYLCSSPLATPGSNGSACNGTDQNRKAYVSQPGVAPMTGQTIEHFRTYLQSRFSYGGFAGAPAGSGWAGKGGLLLDAYWFELWIWTRINRWLLRGNTNGYNASNHIPQWHLDANDIGILDRYQSASYGASITGGGNKFWDVPISDFCGNRWEFTDGLRLYNGAIYTAGKTLNPFTSPSDGYGHASFVATGLSLSGCMSSYSIASYRSESALKLHGIPASTVTAGMGGFDGGGIWFTLTGEKIVLRGGSCNYGARCPGALYLIDPPSSAGWASGARAVLVP
jgi:hypothetical protein